MPVATIGDERFDAERLFAFSWLEPTRGLCRCILHLHGEPPIEVTVEESEMARLKPMLERLVAENDSKLGAAVIPNWRRRK